MRHRFAFLVCGLSAVGFTPRFSVAQQTVPIVTLPAATTKATDAFGAILDVRTLPDGGLLVDDPVRHQVKVLDAGLRTTSVVLDSVRGTPNFYGPRVMPLIPYVADSTLFPDLPARAVSVIDPRGVVGRTLAMPRPNDFGLLRRGAIDDAGRLIFEAQPEILRHSEAGNVPPAVADSTPLLRADFALRRTDTIGYVGKPLRRTDAISLNGKALRSDGTLAPDAPIMSYWSPDPLATIDEWAVLTDGSVAIVRGHDYHIDWIRPDGSKVATAKLPFDWRQLTDGDKQKVIDSARAQRVAAARNNTLINGVDMAGGWRLKPGDAPPGAERMHTVIDTAEVLYSDNNGGTRMMVLPAERRTPDQVFDYYPPVRSGAAMADLNDHLWILPTTSKQSLHGELVYDVVNTKGELFERVRVPLGRYIVGFGHGGVVYLATGSYRTGFYLEGSALPAARSGSSQ